MWLIETETLKLEYFLGDDIPEYAILSHTWGEEEVSFQDWQDLEKASQKRGFAKIQAACAQAREDCLNYIWVDTNCIDKSSSAELSEAINSMFAWYKKSDICYVYLADVDDPDNVADDFGDDITDMVEPEYYFRSGYLSRRKPGKRAQKARFRDSFRSSRWFTRGWTLQELLAPTSIGFFTKDWKPISMMIPSHRYEVIPRHHKHNRQQEPLLRLLSDITGIRVDVLSEPDNIVVCSNGEKMSWIAGRKTTREEDLAYCLLGIFDINMPLLYGEGRKAFQRLQEEIIKQSTDHTLFAWQWPHDDERIRARQPNLFAESPRLFSNLITKLSQHDLRLVPNGLDDKNPTGTIISLTNFGLSVNLELIPTAHSDFVFGVLDFATTAFRNPEILLDRELWCIPLKRMGRLMYRALFPPGPLLLRTRRARSLHPIHLPRTEPRFLSDEAFLHPYAFTILFPDLEIGTCLAVQSLRQIGNAVFDPQRSTVFMPRDILQDGTIAASVLSLELETISVLLCIGAREVNNRVETAVKLFPADTPLETVESTEMTFRPDSFYWDESRSVSLVVSKGHRIDPLPSKPADGWAKIYPPKQPNPVTIFTVSLHIGRNVTDLERGEMSRSESEEESDWRSGESPGSESDVDIS